MQVDLFKTIYDIIFLLTIRDEEKKMEEKHKIQFIEADILEANLIYKDQDDVQCVMLLTGLTGIHSIDDLHDKFAVSAVFEVKFVDYSGEIVILECKKVQFSNIVGLSDQTSEQLSDVSSDLESDEDLWNETEELIKDLIVVAIRAELAKN